MTVERIAAVTTGYASVNGIELYYATYGSGKPLILLHGGFWLGDSFAPILPLLAVGRQVIAVDLQAHGHTADIDRDMTWAAMADDVAALVRFLGPGVVDLMGYSLGGGVALNVAIRHQDLIRRLALVSAPSKRSDWYPEVLAGMEKVDAASAEGLKRTPLYTAYLAAAPRPEDFSRLAQRIGDLLRAPYDWTSDVPKLKMPVLLAYGDADSISPARAAEFFALLGGGLKDADWNGSGMVASRLAILPATTHYNIFTSPQLVPPAIDFFDAPARDR